MVAVAPMLTRCFSLFFLLSCSFAPTKESPDGNVANQPSEPDTHLIDWKILHDEASFITGSVSNFGTRQKLTREREIEIKWVAEQIEMGVK